MILVLIYWAYIFWIFGISGVSVLQVFKIALHPILILLLGAFTITILSSSYSFFGGLGFYFELGLVGLLLLLTFIHRKHYKEFLFSLKAKISELSTFSKGILTILTILCALQSASAPFLIDNESYYLQTIQWLDSYGLVKGVANLHPFLMQFSGWHILQSAVNLDFTGLPINDLSSFMLLLGLYYSVEKMDAFFNSEKTQFLYAGLFIVFSVFLFQFISVPSPDIAVYVLGLILFFECYLWSTSYESDLKTLGIVFILATFAVYIKLTALLLLFIPVGVYLFSKKIPFENDDGLKVVSTDYSRKRTQILITTASISIVTGILFILKNHIISGYALFPLQVSFGDPDWKVASSILQWYGEQTHLDAFQTQRLVFFERPFFDRFLHWVMLPGADGIFNKLIVVTTALFPLVLWKKRWDTVLLILYALSIAQLVLIWHNAPQFRFFFVFFMILFSVSASVFFTKKGLLKAAIITSVIITAIPVVIPISTANLSSTSFLASLHPFEWRHVVVPHPITRYKNLKHRSVQFGNMTIESPVNSEFFWATGDCEVPCVRVEQLEYFKENFKVIPQLRSTRVTDGFYAKPISYE